MDISMDECIRLIEDGYDQYFQSLCLRHDEALTSECENPLPAPSDTDE